MPDLHPHRRAARVLATAVALTGAIVALPTAAHAASPTTGSPVGNVDAVTAVPGGIQLKGWAWDPDTTAPVTIEMRTAAGTVTTVADLPRADVAKAHPTAGGYRGFTVTVPTGTGSQSVCPVVKNVGAGSDKSWTCRTATVASASPSGTLDLVEATPTGVRVAGTASDPDGTGPVVVRVTAGGASAELTTTADGAYAGELASAPGTYDVCATAVNTGLGADAALGCRTATVIDRSPTGAADAPVPTSTGVQVSGWAADPDATGPTQVRVAIAGTTTTLTASTPRPDGHLGYSAHLPVAPGTYQLCTVLVNVGPGTSKNIGCTSVKVVAAPAPTPAPTPTTPAPSNPGAGEPGPTNTGLPAGTALTVHQGDLTITKAGTVVDGLDIRGYVRVKAPNVVIKNSIIRGRPGLTGYMSLIQSPYPDNNLLVEDTTLVAANPSPYVDGIVGKGFTLRRVNIHGVVDQVKITGDNVLVEDSWLHDNLYYLQDPNYGNTPTHDDNVQVQAGRNITIRNNVLQSTHNAAMMITQDAGAVANLTFTNNKVDNGSCSINVAEKSYGPPSNLRITDNTFGLNMTRSRCAVSMKTTTSAIATVTGNLFTDGKAVTITRG